jgi:cohesin loading factor subunit SCC2
MVRESALESIAMICQGWPQHYLRNDVGTAFELVFYNSNVRLQHIVLEGFKLFFLHEEKRSETGAEIKVGDGAVYGQERLAASFIASDNDGAATTIAQKFLQHILNIALATVDDIALSATQVIASINRQGLVHPKECGPALVALETSTHKVIASIAFEGHRTLHQKHESMFEKEYMKAVQRAFMYQKDIIKDVRGILLQPYSAKLRPLVEVLKTGTSKVRKRFLGNICARVDFELPKLEFSEEMPIQVLFARFIMENLAFFEYVRIDELLHLVSCLEKMVVAGTGASVAHAIETDILKVRLQPNGDSQVTNGYYQPDPEEQLIQYQPQELANEPIDHARLRQLAVASMILTMVWETRTHLRTLWGLQKSTKTKITAKDFNKAPTRTPFMNGDKFVERISTTMNALETPDTQLAICKSFAELLSIDHELKITAEEEDEEVDLARQTAGYETPSEGEVDTHSTPGSGKGKKRKSGASLAGQTPKRQRKSATPKKAQARPRKRSRAGSSASADDDEYDGSWV